MSHVVVTNLLICIVSFTYLAKTKKTYAGFAARETCHVYAKIILRTARGDTLKAPVSRVESLMLLGGMASNGSKTIETNEF